MRKPARKFTIDKKLQRALDNFPKLVREEERNFKAREKDIARFSKLSQQLLKLDVSLGDSG